MEGHRAPEAGSTGQGRSKTSIVGKDLGGTAPATKYKFMSGTWRGDNYFGVSPGGAVPESNLVLWVAELLGGRSGYPEALNF
jgi:hypothetical protein